MKRRELQIMAMAASESAPGNYALVLEEVITRVQVVIIIGTYEAQSIAVHLERMSLNRPLTYDAFKATIEALGGRLAEVRLTRLEGEVFHATLCLVGADGVEVSVDARASDALALAVRAGCPITIADNVLEEATIAASEKRMNLSRGSLAYYTVGELEALLSDLLKKEDYESASRIRDMISNRKNG